MAVPPDFVAGQVLTAAQMNKIGGWLVKTEAVGTAVSSVVVSGAFSTDYQHYRVIYAGGVSSASNYLLVTLGATATGYYYGLHGTTYNNTTATGAGNNTTSWIGGYGTSVSNSLDIDIYNPFLADETMYAGKLVAAINGTTGYTGYVGGHLNNTTSYTAFTVSPQAGVTITGGTIYVYGYRD
jgi:hypothetical protein